VCRLQAYGATKIVSHPDPSTKQAVELHSLNHAHRFAVSAVNQQQTTRLGCGYVARLESDEIGVTPPVSPILSGRDQASPNSPSQIANLLTTADARDGTTRLWQLQGDLPALHGAVGP